MDTININDIMGIGNTFGEKVVIDMAKVYIKDHMNKMPEANKALFKMMNKPDNIDSNEEAVKLSIDEVVDTMSDEKAASVFKSMYIARTVVLGDV